MKNTAKKHKQSSTSSSQVISARISTPEILTLRKLYPGSSNQDIVEKLVEEKLARRDFDIWLASLRTAVEAKALDLDQV